MPLFERTELMRIRIANLLLVALWFAGAFVPQVCAQLHPGDLDPTFGVGGKVLTDFGGDETATAVAVQPDGKIVVVGYTNYSDFAVARYNVDGSLDSSFGTGGKVVTDFAGFQDRAYAVA